MPHPCVVCGRSRMNPNNREEEYMFFGFPVNYDQRCKKWLEFCCREDLYKLTKKQLLQRMVCSKHFEKKDFLNEYQDRLNCTAVPTIYDPKQSLYNITCVLCARSRKDPPSSDYDGTTFHHFPGEEFRCLKWLDFVGIDSYYRLTRKEILFCYICSKHFDKGQFVNGYRGRLVDNAVPNIRCPEKVGQYDSARVERIVDTKIFNEKPKRYEPLSAAVLESQACAACGRSRSDPRNKVERYKFHPFPAYEIGRCLRWCQFLGREDLLKMSPNQIRKLVLCSKHFLTGQSFHKVGPCDAVPTIKEINDSHGLESGVESRIADEDRDSFDDEGRCTVKIAKRQDFQRPLVSSKKPKIENKPAPLAKKRGRSKRPTSINIPKLDTLNIENRVRKLPLPPANWKIQIGNNQFQPLTIANTNNTNTITTDGKKVILPFTGNISNLGAPIPVNSLSSIPPGFLIKINLPDQGLKPVKTPRKQRKDTRAEQEKIVVDAPSEPKPVKRRRKKKIVDIPVIEKSEEIEENHDICDYISFPLETQEIDERISSKMSKVGIKGEEAEEEIAQDIIEVLDENFVDMEDGVIDGENEEEQSIHVYHEIPDVEEFAKQQRSRSQSQRTAMSSRARRTLLPIRTEVRYFLQKLTPHMRRLPRKARAQLKLAIVNMIVAPNGKNKDKRISDKMFTVDRIEVLDENFDEVEGRVIFVDEEEESIHVWQNIPNVEEFVKQQRSRNRRERTTSTSSRVRGTPVPIKIGVRYFLHKLQTAEKGESQPKPSIVNMVIDRFGNFPSFNLTSKIVA